MHKTNETNVRKKGFLFTLSSSLESFKSSSFDLEK